LFSSRRRHTRFSRDWSSDVCSSDLADFLMQFSGNAYNGEKQVREALEGKRKFVTDVEGETFRKMLEDRLFTQREMKWAEVKKREIGRASCRERGQNWG